MNLGNIAMEINRLIAIAKKLGCGNIVDELLLIKSRQNDKNVKLVLPLVGEFSAGKTTLINALTDNKQLETASKPTTATIYEVHFGCDRCYAEVLSQDGTKIVVDNISDLKNDNLAEAFVVNVYDTSQKVPSTTVLVDTPGLSSPIPEHKQVLVDFIPQADGILLVVDINAQLTRSLTDFVSNVKMSKRPVYLVLTNSYSKSIIAQEETKKYISENTDLPLEQIVCVSAKEGNLDEFYSLMSEIQKDKNEIVRQVDEQKVKNIISVLLQEINELQIATNPDNDLDNSIRELEMELKRLNRNIEKLVSDTEGDIADIERKSTYTFQNMVFERLNTLVAGKSTNFDLEAVSVINNASSVVFNDYRNNIKSSLIKKAIDRRGTNDAIELHSLETIGLDEYSISGISYNLDLNTIGHKYDGIISSGVKVVATVAAVAAVASTGGAAGGVVGVADMALDAADTITDVQSIVSNKKSVQRIESAVNLIGQGSDKLTQINEYNTNVGSQLGCNNGVVESMVGFFTDKTWGKPQRVRAVNIYIDETLLPEFKSKLSAIGREIVANLSSALKTEANETILRKVETLNQLKLEKVEKQNAYKQRMAELLECKNELQSIYL